MDTDSDELRVEDALLSMWRVRAFEEKVRALRGEGDIVGSVHLCIGQEAIPVGSCAVRGDNDAVFATYRGHGWALACGVPPESLFAELAGRETGVNGGRGGSAYFTAPDWNFFGENSIVGAGAPIAVGGALAARFDGSGRVSICVLGEGALNQGAVHEAFNFAAAFRLPVVFVCEHNRYSELTPTDEMIANPRLHERAAGYGMPGIELDGNNPIAVAAVVREALRRARGGEGPSLVVAHTQRLVGHYIGDAETYRTPGELDAARADEPIARLVRQVGQDVAKHVETTARAEMESAADAALAAPLANPASVKEHLYA